MASYQKIPTGWRVQIQIGKRRVSKVFDTKSKGQIWAAGQQLELKKIRDLGVDDREPFANVLERYAEEQSPKKKGERWERIRLKAIGQHESFKGKRISHIDVPLLAKYRDARLKEVSGSTVNRELNLLSSVFQVAMLEWRLIASNPIKLIKKPKEAPHREKLISNAEIDALLLQIPYKQGDKARTASERVAVAFLFALQTGMRAGEICGLLPGDVTGRVAQLRQTKNNRPRQVPLSTQAAKILDLLPETDGPLFGLTSQRLDALFRKYRDKASLEFRFHDARHTAITVHLAPKLDVLSLAKIIGHSDPRQLMTYYNPTAQSLARLLD
jgi:integrase